MPLFQPKNHVLLDASEAYAHSVSTYRGEKCWSLVFGQAYTPPQILETKRSREAGDGEIEGGVHRFSFSSKELRDFDRDFDSDGNPY